MFLGGYLALSFVYKKYLGVSEQWGYYPDYFTHITGKASRSLIEFFGYKTRIYEDDSQPFLKLIIEDVYIARIIEGCNSISVIILFLAFIIAFASSFKTTALYMLTGSIIIFVANIVRIAVFIIGIYHYPKYTEVLHSVIFPALIYGIVFLLWLVWVYTFSGLKKKND